MQGKNQDTKFFAVLALACCAVFSLLISPMLFTRGLGRTPMGADDASLLHAVQRAEQGHRYSICVQKKERDLAHVTYDYPRTQAPGAMLATHALTRTGLDVETAYKAARALAALLGLCGWLCAARLFLGRGALTIFAILLVFYFSWGWVKLGDTVIWCLAAPYFLVLHSLAGAPKISFPRAGLLTGIIALCLVFWPGSVYLGLSACVSIVLFGRSGIVARTSAGAAVASAGVVCMKIVSAAIAAYAGPGGFIQGVVPGLTPFGIPVAHFLPAVKSLFAEGLGAWMPLKWVFGRAAPEPAARVAALGAPVLLLSAAGWRAWSRRAEDSPLVRFALITAVHFAVLFFILFALSVIFTDGVTSKADVNGIIQADRYLYHLVPALAIVWTAAIAGLVRSKIERGPWRALRAVVIALAAVALPWAAAQRIHSQFVQPGRSTEPAAAFVRAHRASAMRERVKVFDIIAKEHWLAGESRAYQDYYSPGDLRETRNSAPVFVYVVVRKNLAKMPHRPNPMKSAHDAEHMAQALGLDLLARRDNAQVAVYGGLVAPYDPGDLK